MGTISAESSHSISLQESLENTLLINTVKLFSVLAKSDDEVSDAELQYVRTYLNSIYHEPVANYLFEQFEQFIDEDINPEQAAQQIRDSFSYENRVFILMKVYELAASDRVEESERETARSIGRMIGIRYEDICFLETIYDLPTGVTIETSQKSTIQTLHISDEPVFADIKLPLPLVDVDIFHINSIYVLLPKNNRHNVFVGDTQVAGEGFPNVLNATKIQHNQKVTIGNYTINFEDLNYYFQLKNKALLGIALFVSKRTSEQTGEMEYVLSEMPGLDNVLLIEFTKLFILLTPLDADKSTLLVNGRVVEAQEYVNLNDNVMIDNCPINLRKLAFQYGLESETFKLPADTNVYTLGNTEDCNVVFRDAVEHPWQFVITRSQAPSSEGKSSDKGSSSSYVYTLDPKGCPHRIAYESSNVKTPVRLAEEGNIIVGKHVVQFSFLAGACRVEPFGFKDFIARQIRFRFQDNSVALDDISFEIDYGDLVCVIGPSGSGKSTLLNIINGYAKPTEGVVELNSYNLHREYSAIKDYLGYVPQDDLLFENLTVYENLYYNAKLRHPSKSEAEINAIVEQTLYDIDLYEKRNVKAGSPTQRTLSGGQRKRLNIGLELLADADVYFLDEPTSGLSSKDSEKIVELLQRLTYKGKIIFVVIHQPSSKIYKMFDKILFLDKGGKLAFFGDVMSALAYFRNHSRYQHLDPSMLNIAEEASALAGESIEPDVLLATLEEPLRDIDGIPLPKRKYSPDYWKERYARFRRAVSRLDIEGTQKVALPPPRELTFKEKWVQFTTLLKRNFLNKLRDRSNLLITFLEAPALALAVAIILRHVTTNDEGAAVYSLFQNDNLMIFIFLAVIIVIFLAITNSIDDIIKDAAILLRERMLNIGNISYYASKFMTLTVFSIVQNALFLAAAFPILQMRELYIAYLVVLTILSLASIALGLLVSSIPNLSSKAAFNIVPLLLIPQIIFGGALIPYSEMDHLKFDDAAEIPELCQVVPSRWAYEALITMQDGFNKFQPTDDSLQAAAKVVLTYHDTQDQLRAKRDSLAARAAATSAEALAALDGEIMALQAKIEEFERNRPTLDATIEAHRAAYQDKYANQEIHRQVAEARDKFNARARSIRDSLATTQPSDRPISLEAAKNYIPWYHYPMQIARKRIPFTQHTVATVYFNSVVLLGIALVAAIAALGMLSIRERLIDSLQRWSRRLQQFFAQMSKQDSKPS
jgi:ABC-type multidrug transport system ATPase subunit/uncharacterized tellurite resistance protein B-like protein/ABC-type multidrug transport system permease subunit